MLKLFLAALIVLIAGAAPAAAAPSWLPAFPLTGEAAEEPEVAVAVAPDGTTVAAWSRIEGGTRVVEAARRRPGGTFGAPASLGAGAQPQVAVDAAGDATVVWEATTAPTSVVARRLPADADAFEPQELLSSAGVRATAPAIGAGPDGTAVALFTEGPPGDVVVRAAIRDGGAPGFGAARTVSEATTGVYPAGATAAGEVRVAPDGAAVALWSLQDDLGVYKVQTNVRPAGGEFAGTGTTRSGAGATAIEPALAMDGEGRALAAWTEDADGPLPDAVPVVKAVAAQSGGSPVPVTAATPSARPDLAALPDGTVLGAWVVGADGARRVETASAAPGATAFAGHAFLTEAAAGNTYPVVATGADGDALVTWQGFADDGILAAVRPAGGAFGTVTPLADADSAPAGTGRVYIAPAAGVDDEGNATVVWLADEFRESAHHHRVEGAGFDAAPPALTGVSVPATVPAGTAAAMSAAAGDRWGPVTLRWAFGDGTTATGGAVRHAFATGGPFDVTVTATDRVGNASSAVRRIGVTAPPAVAPPPSGRPRVAADVALRWRVRGKRIKLERMRITQLPPRAEAELRCKGRRCPLRRTRSFTPSRRGAIDIVKPLDVDQRRFRAGQRLDLRISAPGHIGQVLRFNLKRGKRPRALARCMPVGSSAIRRSC